METSISTATNTNTLMDKREDLALATAVVQKAVKTINRHLTKGKRPNRDKIATAVGFYDEAVALRDFFSMQGDATDSTQASLLVTSIATIIRDRKAGKFTKQDFIPAYYAETDAERAENTLNAKRENFVKCYKAFASAIRSLNRHAQDGTKPNKVKILRALGYEEVFSNLITELDGNNADDMTAVNNAINAVANIKRAVATPLEKGEAITELPDYDPFYVEEEEEEVPEEETPEEADDSENN